MESFTRRGGRTAWADKHAVYAAVSGPTGTASPSNVDDYYAPDVNSDVIALPGVSTATGAVLRRRFPTRTVARGSIVFRTSSVTTSSRSTPC